MGQAMVAETSDIGQVVDDLSYGAGGPRDVKDL